MKIRNLFIGILLVALASSCAYRTCPTYAKKAPQNTENVVKAKV